ncbi:hypothetical protein KUW18_10010 [Halomonas sp. DP5Y7-2]|uniref:hypothetical protein n=1 Tax=Halomonas sp. DP5Y7-2 TaxID=2859076 RepID=UPI001C99A352|nr:hypothetical protein [Halomonas sp. DP5Y7-2]MBY5984423.1 hypothetical protein [Halomonas sp. DP5Y7-2]
MTTSNASWYDEVVSQERSFTLESEQGKELGTVFFVCDVDEQDLKGLVFKPTGYHPSPDDARQSVQAGFSPQTIGFMGELGGTGEVNNSEERDEASGSDGMDRQDRYIDARLEGIEAKLDARMEAMQRFNEQADERNRDLISRMERQAEQAEGRMSRDFQKLDDRVNTLHDDNRSLRRHVWGAVLTTVLGFAGIVALLQASMGNTISEQGAWIRQNIDRADQERSDTNSTLQSIQATQQSIQEAQAAILNRLPPQPSEAEAQPETVQPSG